MRIANAMQVLRRASQVLASPILHGSAASAGSQNSDTGVRYFTGRQVGREGGSDICRLSQKGRNRAALHWHQVCGSSSRPLVAAALFDRDPEYSRRALRFSPPSQWMHAAAGSSRIVRWCWKTNRKACRIARQVGRNPPAGRCLRSQRTAFRELSSTAAPAAQQICGLQIRRPLDPSSSPSAKAV
jgi:hypothetical protein